MDKLILLCLTFLARTNSKSAPVPSTEALLTGLPKLIHLQTAVPFSLEYPTTWVTGDSGFFFNCPPLSSCRFSPGMQDYSAVEHLGLQHSVTEALGSHTAVAYWQGAVQSGTTRKADMLTTAWSKKMRTSACVWWARMRGGKEGVLGIVPSRAVDESVGRFKGRHFANSEAVVLIPPPLFFVHLNEKSCCVEWEQGQERSDSAG